MPTFTPPVGPSPQTSTRHEPTRLVADFGDGYSQRITRGINQDRRVVTLVWSVLTHSDAQTIEGFFAGLLGVDSFDYQVPGSAASAKWVCSAWTRTEVDDFIAAITAELTEVFDL